MGNWISYIIILILSYIFTYIFELKENYVLLYMIIIAPILDGLLFIYFRRVRVKLIVLKRIIVFYAM